MAFAVLLAGGCTDSKADDPDSGGTETVGAPSDPSGDNSATPIDTPPEEPAFLPPDFDGEVQTVDGYGLLVGSIEVVHGDDFDRLTIEYTADLDGDDAITPGLWVQGNAMPRHVVTGEWLVVEGEAALQVSVMGTLWQPEGEPPAVPTIGDGHAITDVMYMEESGGASVVIIGVGDAHAEFRAFSLTEPYRVVIDVRLP